MIKHTVLVVDDKESNIDVIIEILKDFNVIVSLDPLNALEILKTTSIDIILLDIMMPVMDGFELCEIIKSNESLKDIPILFITSKNDIGSIEKGYQLGAVDYVTKPFHPKELFSRIQTHLKLREMIVSLEKIVDINVQKLLKQEELLLAREKSAEMGKMVDFIAHQWTQPLNIVNMRIQKIAFDYNDDLVDNAYITTFINNCSSQIHHMLETLREFRSFLSTDKELEIFDAVEMLNTCLVLIKDELTQNKITLKMNINKNFTINAVQNEIKHIIINILNNAKDALIAKKIVNKTITIQVSENKIVISDNALGIDSHILDSIFSLDVTTKRKSGGSGIGLYISQKIAQKYSIDLSAVNSNNGAKFTINF